VRVYLVRHAEAEPGEPDAFRRLTPTGRRQANELGEHFAREHADATAVVSSPLVRACETAKAIAAALGLAAEPDERLAPGATAEGLRSLAAERGTVVAVGHQPDCGRIVAAIRGEAPPAFPVAGVCELDL
jgi:phosphohistidine phosphatase